MPKVLEDLSPGPSPAQGSIEMERISSEGHSHGHEGRPSLRGRGKSAELIATSSRPSLGTNSSSNGDGPTPTLSPRNPFKESSSIGRLARHLSMSVVDPSNVTVGVGTGAGVGVGTMTGVPVPQKTPSGSNIGTVPTSIPLPMPMPAHAPLPSHLPSSLSNHIVILTPTLNDLTPLIWCIRGHTTRRHEVVVIVCPLLPFHRVRDERGYEEITSEGFSDLYLVRARVDTQTLEAAQVRIVIVCDVVVIFPCVCYLMCPMVVFLILYWLSLQSLFLYY